MTVETWLVVSFFHSNGELNQLLLNVQVARDTQIYDTLRQYVFVNEQKSNKVVDDNSNPNILYSATRYG